MTFRLYNTIVFLHDLSLKVVSPLTTHIWDFFFFSGSSPVMQ